MPAYFSSPVRARVWADETGTGPPTLFPRTNSHLKPVPFRMSSEQDTAKGALGTVTERFRPRNNSRLLPLYPHTTSQPASHPPTIPLVLLRSRLVGRLTATSHVDTFDVYGYLLRAGPAQRAISDTRQDSQRVSNIGTTVLLRALVCRGFRHAAADTICPTADHRVSHVACDIFRTS